MITSYTNTNASDQYFDYIAHSQRTHNAATSARLDDTKKSDPHIQTMLSPLKSMLHYIVAAAHSDGRRPLKLSLFLSSFSLNRTKMFKQAFNVVFNARLVFNQRYQYRKRPGYSALTSSHSTTLCKFFY